MHATKVHETKVNATIVKIDRTAKRMMRRGAGAAPVPRPTKVNEKDQDEGRECLWEDNSHAHGSFEGEEKRNHGVQKVSKKVSRKGYKSR